MSGLISGTARRMVAALQITVANYTSSIAAAAGASLMGFAQGGAGAIARTVQAKLREAQSAADYGAAGASTVTDSAAIQAAAAAVAAAGGGLLRIPAFVATSIDLAGLGLPTSVVLVDERYSSSGWHYFHGEGDDVEVGIRGRATALGEGPSLVMENLANTGNRNASIVHRYGPGHTVASFEHWGYNADGSWYPGREWLGKGTVDTGHRARTRCDGNGTFVVNPNGDANSYRNNPAKGFVDGYVYTINAPLQTGYAKSGKYLLGLHTDKADLGVELRIQNAARLAFQTGTGPTAVDRFGIIPDFPSAGQFTLYDYVAGAVLATFNSGGLCSFSKGVQLAGSIAAATAPNGSIFIDSADSKIKAKGTAGTLTVLAAA